MGAAEKALSNSKQDEAKAKAQARGHVKAKQPQPSHEKSSKVDRADQLVVTKRMRAEAARAKEASNKMVRSAKARTKELDAKVAQKKAAKHVSPAQQAAAMKQAAVQA